MPKSTKKPNKNLKKIYLDYASASLLREANPSAIHNLGVKEKNKLEKGRERVAHILDARPDEIIFTSGATESNNLAILGLTKGHVVTTNIEHASVLETVKYQGSVTYVEVEQSGIVDPQKIKKALHTNTILVSVMYANNEIGTVQPIREIIKEIRHFNKINKTKILLHTDATQAVNYLDINVERLGVDMMSFNGAKIYGPKGVGVLYKRRSVELNPIMHGGDQEMGLRPGTENVPAILEFAKALESAQKNKDKESARLTKLRDYFIKNLDKIGVEFVLNGDTTNRLPNNVNITIPKIPSDLLVLELDARGIMCSSKSACKSGDGKASYVIEAINKNIKETDGSIRFSLGADTKEKDIQYTIKALKEILQKLKKWYN